MKRCFIYAAGTFYGLREPPRGGDLQIAADAGLHLCERLGVRPDVVLGDFDSMDVRQAPADCIRVPVEKDDTDTMLALREGLKRGCDTFYLYGATGGARLDHTLANLQTLRYIADHGALGWLTGEGWVVTAVRNGALRFGAQARGFLSVFCSGDTARGVTLRGLKYELEDAALTCGVPLGVSNEFLGKPALVRVADGCLFVLWQGEAAPEAADDAGLD